MESLQPSVDPPPWLKQFFACVRFILEETYHALMVLGFIAITALGLYNLAMSKWPTAQSVKASTEIQASK